MSLPLLSRLRAPTALAGALALWIAACGPAAGGGDPEYWTPWLGAGGASGTTTVTTTSTSDGGAGTTTGTTTMTTSGAGGGGTTTTTPSNMGGGGPVGPATGDLNVDFTTVTFKGKYSPSNVVAVWVTNEQGAFVKTLGVFATKRIKYLVTWLGASGGNTVDAVTSATFSEHGPRSLKWDSTNADGQVVPDGTYRVYIEFTEQNKLGKFTSFSFTKGHAPFDLSPPDEPNFKDVHVVYAP